MLRTKIVMKIYLVQFTDNPQPEFDVNRCLLNLRHRYPHIKTVQNSHRVLTLISSVHDRKTMSGKTVIVTGATGLLGRQVVEAFNDVGWNVIGTGLSRAKPPTIRKVDLLHEEEVVSLFHETRPHVLVHCAAERSPDKCASSPMETKRLNITATRFLAQACACRDIFMIYLSTDYVFPGTPGEAPYAANASPQPPNFYGQTKLDGEHEVLAIPVGKGLVFRVAILYGEVEENKESAVNVLLDSVWNREGKTQIEMDHWSVRYPTNTEDVARVLKDVAIKYVNASAEDLAKLPRVLQFSAEEEMTKYEICQILAGVLGLPLHHMKPNDSNDPNASVRRPYNCHLSTQELKDIGINVSAVPFKDWWQRYLGAYKK